MLVIPIPKELIEYAKSDVSDVSKALKSGIRTSDRTAIDEAYFRTLIEKYRDQQIKELVAGDDDERNWVQSIRDEYGRKNYDKTTRNYIFYRILEHIGEKIGGWGKPNYLSGSNHPEAYFIYERVYSPLKVPYKISVFLAWLWRDHTDVAIKFYEDLQLYDLVQKHKQRIARKNQEAALQPALIEKQSQSIAVSEKAQIDARGMRHLTILNAGILSQMNFLPDKAIALSFGQDDAGGFRNQDLHFPDLKESKKTSLYEVFENKRFIGDNGLIETCQVKPKRSFYRNLSWMIMENALLDASKVRLIDNPCAFIDNVKGFDLLSVGGSRSCPSVRISLGGEVDGSVSEKYGGLYYSFDLTSTKIGVQDNFGQNITSDPRTFIRVQKGEPYHPSTMRQSEKVYLLTQDLALLTIVVNPFDHGKRHVLISACHGIGCVALSELINEPHFQKETNFIDFLDTSDDAHAYYQALVSINVFWNDSQKRYDICKDSGKYYEVKDVKSNLKLKAIRSVPDAVALYQDIIKARIKSEAAVLVNA